MATGTHTLLERITVGAAGAASVTFSSIPQTGYTDLKIVYSARTNASYASNGFYFQYSFNGSTANFTQKNMSGNGASATSTSASAFYGISDPSDWTASTFSNGETYIPNYTSSNYKSISQDVVGENNSTTAYDVLYAGLWSQTAAITSVTLTPAGGSWVQYSTFSLYGIAASGTTPTKAPKAVGGDIIQTDGTYWYHAFINTGAFVPATGLTADVLVVAGGGSGGPDGGGGGGAGGLVAYTSQSLPSGTSQTVTIGAGGSSWSNGVNSQFGSLTAAVGGGKGGSSSSTLNGGSGGSGGGGASYGSGTTTGGAATSGQGNAGGGNGGFTGSPYPAGGGGGAGASGSNASSSTVAGAGGVGVSTYSSWGLATSVGDNQSGTVYFAGGGGGGSYVTSGTAGVGGYGGGGKGQAATANVAGAASTGGGGGGASAGANPGSSVAGGSGVVIVRYLA